MGHTCRRIGWLVLASPVVLGVASCRGSDDTTEAPGDLRAFNPITAYPAVWQYAGFGAALLEIDARYVRSDGTINAYAEYQPQVSYAFLRPAADAREDLPIGARPPSWQRVEVLIAKPRTRRVQEGNSTYNYRMKGMERSFLASSDRRGDVVPPPQCGFAAVWRVAVERGFPSDGVARIRYTREDDLPTYTFWVDTVGGIELDADCQLTEDRGPKGRAP